MNGEVLPNKIDVGLLGCTPFVGTLRGCLCNAHIRGKVGRLPHCCLVQQGFEGGNRLFRRVFCYGEDPEILPSGVRKWCCGRGNVGFPLPQLSTNNSLGRDVACGKQV